MGDKQTQAVIYNFKEQKRLEKTLQMLKIEEAYAVSLINLDNKVLKIGFKRLKDRVAKTKSHLTNDQIAEMKRLEEQGEIKEKVINMESEIKIAAAEKRLKLWSDKKAKSVTPRAQTARPRLEQESRRSSMSAGTHSLHSSADMKTFKEVREMRRKSIDIRDSLVAAEAAFKYTDKKLAKSRMQMSRQVSSSDVHDRDDGSTPAKRKVDIKTDAFLSTFSADSLKRRKSVEIRTPECDMNGKIITDDDSSQFDKESRPILKQTSELSESKHVSIIKPANMMNDGRNSVMSVKPRNISIRPQTGGCHTQTSKPFNKKRPATSLINASRDKSNNKRGLSKLITRTPFSSHDLDQKDKNSTLESPFRSIREGAMTAYDERSIDKDMSEEIYKAFKMELLRKEAASGLHIEDKIDNFFEKVGDYIDGKDTSQDPTNCLKIHVPIFSKSSRSETKSPTRRNQMRRLELEQAVQGDEETNKKMQQIWKDVNKCRYLRLPEGKIDMTGIQTLASDQMKLYNAFRRGEYA